MDPANRPRRSALYMPGSKPRALEKARGLPADVLIFDLEDAVLPAEKSSARDMVVEAVQAGGYAPREVVIRVNALDTEWGEQDLAAVGSAGADAVLLPKVCSPQQVDAAAAHLASPDLMFWAMIETAAGVLAAAEIAAHPRIGCLVAGTNDLAEDLRAKPGPDRGELSVSLQTCVLAARAHGITALDGVFNAFKDSDGLAAECRQGRALGFDGKTLIHPAQVAVSNEIFGPSAADVDLAQRQIAAFEEAVAEGQGIAVLDGKIVENLHVATARATIAQKAAIDALQAELTP